MKEKYYLLDQHNQYYEFNSWKNMITWLNYEIGGYDERKRKPIKSIGHNLNDTWCIDLPHYVNGDFIIIPQLYYVNYVVYDCLWRVVDKRAIEEGLKKYISYRKNRYKRRRTVYAEFRREPVPRTGRCIKIRQYYRQNVKRNKSYTSKLLSYTNLFPSDSRMRELIWFTKSWNDDLSQRTHDRSWKHQTKCKKQWQKNL